MLALCIGVVIGLQAPTPERPPIPEMEHFLQYRADYEHVVELAKNDQLRRAGPDCPAGYQPPRVYEHVSAARCMFLNQDLEHGLRVEFTPLDGSGYHDVTYVEIDEGSNPCGYKSHVEQKIDDHWYVCEEEWL